MAVTNMLSRVVSVTQEVSSTYPAAVGTSSYAGTTFSSAIHQFRNTTPVAVDTNVQDLGELRETFTTTGLAVGRQLYRFTPGLVLMGIGNATNLPGATHSPAFRLGRYLRMCGMQQTATDNSSSLTYKFRSSGFENGFIDVCQNDTTGSSGILYRMQGTYGTLTMSGSAGNVIEVNPTLSGLVFAQPARVAALTTVTLPAAGNTAETMKSEGLSLAGVTGGTIASADIKFKSFNLDLGVDVQEDTDANSSTALAGLIIAGRQPTLQLVIAMDSARIADLYTDYRLGSIITADWTHGTSQTDARGRRCRFTATGQITGMTQGDEVGLRTVTLDMRLVNATADQELTLVFS